MDAMIPFISEYEPIRQFIDENFPVYVPGSITVSVSQTIRVRILSASIVPNPATINESVVLEVDAQEENGPVLLYHPTYSGTIYSGMQYYSGQIPTQS